MSDILAVLSIEDSKQDFELIEAELERSGLACRCHRVDEKGALLAALENEHWDVVLSDYSVPGLYFPEILAQIRKRWPELPIILVSGTLGEVKAAVMVKLGARDFVFKDYLRELVPAIRRHIPRAGGS